ncbi:MAG: hypothetical protein M9894_20930 [Planctomycetes bacterium]|nr:hypothetical protein [Planctomycetota bacterium]
MLTTSDTTTCPWRRGAALTAALLLALPGCGAPEPGLRALLGGAIGAHEAASTVVWATAYGLHGLQRAGAPEVWPALPRGPAVEAAEPGHATVVLDRVRGHALALSGRVQAALARPAEDGARIRVQLDPARSTGEWFDGLQVELDLLAGLDDDGAGGRLSGEGTVRAGDEALPLRVDLRWRLEVVGQTVVALFDDGVVRVGEREVAVDRRLDLRAQVDRGRASRARD